MTTGRRAVLLALALALFYGAFRLRARRGAHAPVFEVTSISGRKWAAQKPHPSRPPADVRFLAEKPPGTVRIFCLGTSATEGFPFNPVGGYPAWLGAYLSDVVPGVKTEVITAGWTGHNSAKDIKIVEELLGFAPDILVLYESDTYAFHAERDEFALRDPELSRYKEVVSAMIKLARRRAAHVVLLGQVNTNLLAQPESHPNLKRSHPDLNRWLSQSGDYDTVYLDLLPLFQAEIRKGRPIHPDLLVDSSHPSLAGHQLIAQAIARKLSEGRWVAEAKNWRWANLRSENAYRQLLRISDHFEAVGLLQVAWHIAENERGKADLVPIYISMAEQLSPGIAKGQVRGLYGKARKQSRPGPRLFADALGREIDRSRRESPAPARPGR